MHIKCNNDVPRLDRPRGSDDRPVIRLPMNGRRANSVACPDLGSLPGSQNQARGELDSIGWVGDGRRRSHQHLLLLDEILHGKDRENNSIE